MNGVSIPIRRRSLLNAGDKFQPREPRHTSAVSRSRELSPAEMAAKGELLCK